MELARCSVSGGVSLRTYAPITPCCSSRRAAVAPSSLRRPTSFDVSASATTSVVSAGILSPAVSGTPHQNSDVSCRAVLVAERQTSVVPSSGDGVVAPVGTPLATPSGPKSSRVDNIDIAVVGADVSGLAAALAAARANPGARVMLYDSASEPPAACDGGVLLSRNGLMALKKIDANLYTRITTELASPVIEALWFDLEGELVRRTPLGNLSAGGSGVASVSSGSSSGRRRGALRRARPQGATASSGVAAELDATAPPLIVSLHDLREALAEALPEDVQIFGRHHVTAIEPAAAIGTGTSTGGVVLRFAASPSGSPVRSVRAKMLVGADGPRSAVKRLHFDAAPEEAPLSGRVVWRGRFTLRQRDPDFARLRNFTSATRTWMDLRASHGSERIASLSPAGPNTYVWSASCPAALLTSRGLSEERGASSYWRCLAMFEDFPQDFFAALRNTAASAVVEYGACRVPPGAAAVGLAAPWRWFSGLAALVGDAVYSLPVDDVSSTAVNLALEDAAVLGSCTGSYGLTARALQEYARQRGPRVSSLLALPPSSLERARLRDAPFIQSPPTAHPAAPAVAADAANAAAEAPSLASTVASAVDAAASAAVAVTSPTQPLDELLVKAMKAGSTASAAATRPELADSLSAVGPPEGRPSGGASRAPSPSSLVTLPPLTSPAGLSSPFFSRPSGARRLGPVPAAIAAVIGILATGAASARSSASFATCSVPAAAAAPLSDASASADADAPARDAVPTVTVTAAESLRLSEGGNEGGNECGAASVQAATAPLTAHPLSSLSPSARAPYPPRYTASSTPRSVWVSLLQTRGWAPAPSAPRWGAREYCAFKTPAAVWQALLVAPRTAHDMLAKRPYNAMESPALVWMALLGAPSALGEGAIVAAGASAANSTSALGPPPSHDSPCTLLPRPVLKHKPQATAPTAVVASGTAGSAPAAPQSEASASGVVDDAAASSLALPQRQGLPAAAAGSSPPSPGLESQQRRRLRSHAGPVSGRWAGGDRCGSGGKTKRSTAAGASRTATTATAAGTAAGSVSTAAASTAAASKAKASAKAAAAKAAATVTASLSAAAALGGVIGAGTGHMPVDMAAALHAHSTVAQFWEDLNNLSLSSASLSSIDLS